MFNKSLSKLLKKASYDFKVSDLKQVWYDLQSLDSQNYGSWPLFIRCLMLLGVFVSTLILGYTLFLSNHFEQQKALMNEYQTLVDSQQKLTIRVKNTHKNGDEIQRIRQQIQPVIEPLVQANAMADIMEKLNLMAGESGVLFQDISVADPVFSFNEQHSASLSHKKGENNNSTDNKMGSTESLEAAFRNGKFTERLISIKVSGNYHKFGDFFNRLAATDYAISINDYEVTYNQSNPITTVFDPNHSLSLTMSIKVYQNHQQHKSAHKSQSSNTAENF